MIKPDGSLENEFMHYSSLNSHTTDILDVIKDIAFLKELARNEDYRLSPLMQSRASGYDKAMSGTRSISGKMWNYLTTTTQSFQIHERSSGPEKKMNLRELIDGQQGGNNNGPGNQA